jgi:hypothetical protein
VSRQDLIKGLDQGMSAPDIAGKRRWIVYGEHLKRSAMAGADQPAGTRQRGRRRH